MKKKTKPVGAVATVTLFGVFTRLISFLFKIYLSRLLGAEALGLFQIALSVFLLFASLSASGIPMVLSRRVAEADALKKKNDFSIFTTALLYAVSLAFFVVVTLMLLGTRLSFLFSDPLALPLFLIMVPALLSTAVYCVVRGWFWGKKMFTVFSLAETLEECLRILFSVLLLSGILGAVSGARAIAYAFTCSDIIVGVILLLLYFLKGGTLKKPSSVKEIFLPALPITAMRVCASVFSTLLAILLPAKLIASGFTATEATSAFGRITGMANPLLFVPTTVTGSIAIVLLPDVSALHAKKDFLHLNQRVSFGFNFSLLMCGLFTALYFVLGEKITLFLYGDALSGKYLSVAALSMLPMCASQMSQSVLNSIGKEKQTFVTYLAGNVVMIILIALLPKYLGIYSVAVATATSFTIDSICNCIILHKETGWGRESVKYILLSSVFSMGTALFTYSFLPYWKAQPNFVGLVFCALVGVLTYAILCFVSGLIDVDVLLTFYKNKAIKRGKNN